MSYHMKKIYKIILRNGNLNKNLGGYLPAYDTQSPMFLRNLSIALEKAEAEAKAEALREQYKALPGKEGIDFIV